MADRLEPPHRKLPESGWLMLILAAIVLPLILAVLDTGQHLSFHCAVAPEFVGDDHIRDIPQSL